MNVFKTNKLHAIELYNIDNTLVDLVYDKNDGLYGTVHDSIKTPDEWLAHVDSNTQVKLKGIFNDMYKKQLYTDVTPWYLDYKSLTSLLIGYAIIYTFVLIATIIGSNEIMIYITIFMSIKMLSLGLFTWYRYKCYKEWQAPAIY